MNQGTPDGGCPECGATVGHREVPLDPIGTTAAYKACSLGQDSVPRAELTAERKRAEAAERNSELFWGALGCAIAEGRGYLTQLGVVQARCTELLEEVRALRTMHTEQAGTIVTLLEEVRALKQRHLCPVCPVCDGVGCFSCDTEPPYCGAV